MHKNARTTKSCSQVLRRQCLLLFIVYTAYTVTVLCQTQQEWPILIVNTFMISSNTKKMNLYEFLKFRKIRKF